MKKTLFGLALLIGISIQLQAQVNLGLKMGVQSSNIGDNIQLQLDNLDDPIQVNADDLNYGFHVGPIVNLSVLGLRFETGALLNFNQTTLENINDNGSSFKKNFSSIDFPFLLGVKLLFVDIHGGILAHKYFNLEVADEIKSGYILGAGIDIGKVSIDFDFELNPNKIEYIVDVTDDLVRVDEYKNQMYVTLSYLF